MATQANPLIDYIAIGNFPVTIRYAGKSSCLIHLHSSSSNIMHVWLSKCQDHGIMRSKKKLHLGGCLPLEYEPSLIS